ncbi:non-canonical purine NTP pyrophosphatase [Nannocystis radixulma]|uniref:Non-canonical purine NTP pyrophosphatase n=1 Tax=Nannocystis radixulma TaxID=2995305 RepID=A0ABT5BMM9_9BACT|nr:non-canonical purine NTP pyrophosphatase [Nannocystis radixulma]MDC0674759.1 non-canonical purine NTP pyrophosphatase [Nannocystis radixulma]
MTLHFCSSNAEKHADVVHLFRDGVPPLQLWHRVDEILSSDLEVLVRAKAIAAYEKARVPLFVEHGGLFIQGLNGLPGPLVKLFWEKLPREELIRLIPDNPAARRAEFRHIVCYCDGKKLRTFMGRVAGRIAPCARGSGGIHWEPIFSPNGQTRTFGEMTRGQRLACLGERGAVAKLRRALGR